MSEDSFTEVTHQSWFSRLGKSMTGILFGLILVIGAFPLLFWNEGRAVKTLKSLEEGQKLVKELNSDDASLLNNQLVHFTGMLNTPNELSDPIFNLKTKGVKLKRKVEMYQWEEYKKKHTEKKVGGGKRTYTTYHYNRDWSTKAHKSNLFRKKEGHQNPSFPLKSAKFSTNTVKITDYKLGSDFTSQLDNWKAFGLTKEQFNSAQKGFKYRNEAVQNTKYLFYGSNPSSPQIGDLRISFEKIPLQTVSVVGKFQDNFFTPYNTRNKRELALIAIGEKTAIEMFSKAKDDNSMMTWILRLVGFLMFMFGFMMTLKLLAVLGDNIPFVGSLIGAGVSLISFILALILSLLTIASGWLFYRPVLGGLLLLSSILLIFYFRKRVSSHNR
jgi:hypothetical protein